MLLDRGPASRLCSRLLLSAGLAVALLWVLQLGAASEELKATTDALPFTSAYYGGANERFGVGLAPGILIEDNGVLRSACITDYDTSLLHIGWYANWMIDPHPLRPNGIRYAQLLLVRASEYPTNTRKITDTVAANPGALWIVGNEPEGKYSQGNRTPAEYAQIYHDVYQVVKGLDPAALLAIGGVIQPTPLRLQWLEMVLDEYRSVYGSEMPVDVWNIHVQILQEKAGTPQDPTPWGAEIPAGLPPSDGVLYAIQDNANSELFCELVRAFRLWMKDQGFRDKPLIISEYGVLMPSDILADGDTGLGDHMVIRFMRNTFEFLVTATDPHLGYPADDNRLVQQWLWYSLNDRPFDGQQIGFNGSLFSHSDPEQITVFGAVFREYMHSLMGYPRLVLPEVMN